MSINKVILEKRKELGLTQQELAHKLGVTDRSVSRWEKGTSTPDIHSLKRLSEILNVSMNTFYDNITVEPISNELVDTPIINKFTTLSILSIGLLFISFISFLFAYYLDHGSKLSVAFQMICFTIIIISVTIFTISCVSFSLRYHTKKLQNYYKRLMIKHLIAFVVLFIILIILIITIGGI